MKVAGRAAASFLALGIPIGFAVLSYFVHRHLAGSLAYPGRPAANQYLVSGALTATLIWASAFLTLLLFRVTPRAVAQATVIVGWVLTASALFIGLVLGWRLAPPPLGWPGGSIFLQIHGYESMLLLNAVGMTVAASGMRGSWGVLRSAGIVALPVPLIIVIVSVAATDPR